MQAIIDVGANHGLFCIPAALRNPDRRVIAIEPVPALAKEIRDLAPPNLIVVEAAVTPEPGRRVLHISNRFDMGVSSLLDLDTATISANEYWSVRKDLVYDAEIEVDCLPLRDICSRNGITGIDFLKIDAQGLDLDVLRSLGSMMEDLGAGMLECPSSQSGRLYEGEPDLFAVHAALAELGFRIQFFKPNDPACAEVNVFFCRNGADYARIEESCHLRGIDGYDGRHYWHKRSSDPVWKRPIGELVESKLRRGIRKLAALFGRPDVPDWAWDPKR